VALGVRLGVIASDLLLEYKDAFDLLEIICSDLDWLVYSAVENHLVTRHLHATTHTSSVFTTTLLPSNSFPTFAR